MSLLRSLIEVARGAVAVPPVDPGTLPSTIAAPERPLGVGAPTPSAPVTQTTITGPMDAEPILPPEYLLGIIGAHDDRQERSREGGTAGFMHVSSLISMDCRRRAAIMSQHGVEHGERVSGGHRIMWAIGRAVEKHIRGAIIESTGAASAFGGWACRCDYSQHIGMRPAHNVICPKCEHRLDIYKEMDLTDADARITGHPDLLLLLIGFLLVVEVKSMDAEQFDALTEAVPDHANQALMYREMLRRRGFKVFNSVRIVYARKRFRWGGARGREERRVYKEFTIDATERRSQALVDLCYDAANDLAQHAARGTLPERRVCGSSDCSTARGCPVAHLCFSLTG